MSESSNTGVSFANASDNYFFRGVSCRGDGQIQVIYGGVICVLIGRIRLPCNREKKTYQYV